MLRLSALHCNSAYEISETDFEVVGNAKKWISSFLSCRAQCVLIDIDCGVLQGCCMGPILFNMYVTGIFNVVKN